VIARLRIPALLCVIAIVALSCKQNTPTPAAFSGDLNKGNPTTSAPDKPTIDNTPPAAKELSDDQTARLNAALQATPQGCDVLVEKSCMLPFPSDYFTVEDTASPTGRRVNLPTGQLKNTAGTPLDPTAWNLNDGFSPATPIVVYVPGIDPVATGLPSVTEIAKSITTASPTVLVDLDTGQLVPHWAEMDERATSDANRSLVIHPAASLIETHRIAVALRKIYGTDGVPLPSPIQYQVLRDNLTSNVPQLEDRKAANDVVFKEMATAGVARSGLYLSWWFTVSSAKSLSGRVLSMRDDALGKLAGSSPSFTVTRTGTDKLQKGIARTVSGTFQVPLYLDNGGAPGSRMTFDSAGQPVQSGEITANFTCDIPATALKNGEARPVVYGHGLLGDSTEVTDSDVQVTAASGNFVYCSTDALGLSEGDVPFVATVLGDLSLFPSVPDRLQQAILNYLYLGRLMVNESGLGSDKAFQTTSGANMLDTSSAYFDGNSQGAILGGAITAVAQDWTKAVLGVGGMGYATLLNRSVDFDKYFAIMRLAYPDPVEQQILFAVIQMLWDRGETSGYVQHLTDRAYDTTPPHQVLMTVAFGDHQVANVTADNIARTLKLPLYHPVLPKGADDVSSAARFFNLSPIRKFPYSGSAYEYWYSGTLPPPNGNITPIQGPLYAANCQGTAADTSPKCTDPHGDPRRQPGVMEQKDAFFKPDGKVINVCNDKPCISKTKSELGY